MPEPALALLPSPALFDVTTVAAKQPEGTIERVPLDRLELAPNARRVISSEGIARLAAMLMRTGQLVPCIGRRPDPAATRTVIYDGQRRLLAAQASEHLAGTAGFEQLAPVRSLIVLLLDHEPSDDEIRRIQAQANRSEELALTDQQDQFRDCWQARAGLPDDDRIAAVCADLGISARRAHNLLRQLTLPEPIRSRVAERPGGDQLSVTMANKLADMHEIAPELTLAVAERITTTDLHEKALRDLGAFVHRTVVENEHTYAIRVDDGALLDGADQIEQARAHLTPAAQRAGRPHARLHPRRARRRARHARPPAPRRKALKIRVDGALRDRARTGRYAYVHERGRDFAAASGSSTRCSCSTSYASTSSTPTTTRPATRRYFSGARLDDDELRAAAEQDRQRRAEQRARHAERLHRQPRARARHARRPHRPQPTRSCTRSRRSCAT